MALCGACCRLHEHENKSNQIKSNLLCSNPEGLSPTAELGVRFASKRIPHSFIYVIIFLKEWDNFRKICHGYICHVTKI